VFLVFWIEGAQKLHAIHELRDTCRDVMIAIETYRTIRNSLGSASPVRVSYITNEGVTNSRLTVWSTNRNAKRAETLLKLAE
jgi:hypothetical protein